MAWVRIDDAVTEHRKHLKAGPAASWLWVCGIAYCQRQLTDGFIPDEAVPLLGVMKGVKPLVDALVAVGLFERADGGYRVHDYLEYNASREEALRKQADTRATKARAGAAGARKRWHRPSQSDSSVPSSSDSRTIAPSHPIPDDVQNTSSAPPLPDRRLEPDRRTPPGRVNGRIYLHPWQFAELDALLGPHMDAFGLDEWLDNLSARADQQSLTFPSKKGRWDWVLGELRDEITRRSLPVATAAADPAGRPSGPTSNVPSAAETRRRQQAMREGHQ